MNFKTVGQILALFTATVLSMMSFGWIPALAQTSNGYYIIPPDACSMTPATTAFDAAPILNRVAAGNAVLEANTNTTAGTIAVACAIDVPGRLAGGTTINSVELLYGVQTTAIASIAAGTINRVTYPASTAAGAAAAGTVTTTAGGTLTVTPTALQLTTTTTGQCFHERIVLGTPAQLNPNTRLVFDQVFTTTAGTDTNLQICGLIVNYTTSQ